MVINCLEINQVINELLIAFQDCNKIKNSDLRRLVELVSAVNRKWSVQVSPSGVIGISSVCP